MLQILDQQGALRPDAAAVVLATMIWPGAGEDEKRADLLAWSHFEARQVGVTNYVSVVDLHRIAGKDIRKPAQRRQKLGHRAGHLALSLLRLTVVTPRQASLNAAAALSGSVPLNGQPAKRLNAKMLAQRPWLEVRPAAPLWASAYIAEHEDPWSHDWTHHPAALIRMLRLAEAIRLRFESVRVGNARGPILPPGLAWRPPITFCDGMEWSLPALDEREREVIADQRANNQKPQR